MAKSSLFVVIFPVLLAFALWKFNAIDRLEGKVIFDSTLDQYLVTPLLSPRLAGHPLKIFGYVINTPLLGNAVAYFLYKLNKIDIVQK